MPGSLTLPLCPWRSFLFLGWDPAQPSAGFYPLVSKEDSEGVGEIQEQEGE